MSSEFIHITIKSREFFMFGGIMIALILGFIVSSAILISKCRNQYNGDQGKGKYKVVKYDGYSESEISEIDGIKE